MAMEEFQGDPFFEALISNCSNTTGHDDGHHSNPTMILFIFGACCIGAFTRTVFKKVPLPYTILLLLFGGLFGLMATELDEVEAYASIVHLDPHVILHVFLPVLIFESAFAMDVHTFLKSILQIMILAIPGFIIAAFLTGTFVLYTFQYDHWTWAIAIMFGAIISATDPVAVVALLKELGASKTMGVLIEGESLLNDGAAIVVFNVCTAMATGGDMSAGEIVIYFVRVALGGPVFGFLMAKLTIIWLLNIYNDALTEITITLASTYITFYIGEVFLKVSGVLAVVALGITINLERTSISPEVEAFLHRFWEMLAYLANTLIFVIVGVVITITASKSTDLRDWGFMLILYLAISVIRPTVILILSPALRRTGYGMQWREASVVSWSGLRGAVGLALALIVQKESFHETIKAQILLHSAGIVLLTLLVNGTTVGKFLELLGMREISAPKRMAMASAVRTLNDTRQHSFNIYKQDRFLADADWETVQQCVKIKDPYKTVDEEADMDELTNLLEVDTTKEECTECSKTALETTEDEVGPELMNQMREEARLRLLKAQKTSFVRQFAHGMLSREAVRKLIECVDSALDTEKGNIDIDEIKKTWQIKGPYASLKRRLEKWKSQKPDTDLAPPPENAFLFVCYRIVMHSAFEVFIYIVILLNVVTLCWQLIAESQLCEARFDEIYGEIFFILNMIFYAIYAVEAIIKMIGLLPKPYFKSNWNKFDFLILILSTLDIIADQVFFKDASSTNTECSGSGTGQGSTFSPGIMRIARIVRLLRILRSLRLVRGLIPQLIGVFNKQINKQIRYGYDVGKGYVMAEEDVSDYITHLIDNDIIRNEIRMLVSQGRLTILKELALLQKDHPGIAVSVKTQQAARRILNNIQQKIDELSTEGALDSAEGAKLHQVVETQMKKLLTIPPVIPPPPPETVLRYLEWANEDAELMEYLNQHALLVNKMDGETFIHTGDDGDGIYVIISGLVRIEAQVEDNTSLNHMLTDAEYIRDIATRGSDLLANLSNLRVTTSAQPSRNKMEEPQVPENVVVDYLSAGSIIGEVSLLTNQPRNANAICASAVELYHIPFDVIRPALALDDKEPSLEYRLWKVCAIRIASTVLRNHFAYKRWTMDKIKLYLERSLVYVHKQTEDEEMESPPFEVSPVHMLDVVLIHGITELDANNEQLVGPCYINNTVRRLHLVSSPTHVILVVPRGNMKFNPLSTDESAVPRTLDPQLETSAMCLKHASLKRVSLASAVSSHMLAKPSTSNLARGSSHHIGLRERLMSRSVLARKSKMSSKDLPALRSSESAQIPEHIVLEMQSESTADVKQEEAATPEVETRPPPLAEDDEENEKKDV